MTIAAGDTADRLYTRKFFEMFGAVMLFMTGVALQFHFGQYLEYLGHGVDTLGRILSISMVGTLFLRLNVGRWIDRLGCRPTWLVGTLVVAVAVGSIQFTSRLWLVTLLRAIWAMAMASVMTTVPVFAAQIAPPRRRAEAIGTIGMAGFTGMIIGPTVGDWIFTGAAGSIVPYRVFFSASAACSLLACGVMMLISLPTGSRVAQTGLGSMAGVAAGPPPSRERQSHIRIVLRHWPGAILLIGVVFSMVFCLQVSFLERLAEARGFKDIKMFFLIYGPTAMTLRVVFRRVPQQVGRSRTLVGGLLLLSVGLLCLVGVRSQWGLVLPGLLMGAGHCFIFPSMVDLAAERLPPEYRGTGTALIMAAGDLGMLTGFVTLGELMDGFGFDVALIALAATVLFGTSVFAVARRNAVFFRRGRPLPEPLQETKR
jgi:MFS family permease